MGFIGSINGKLRQFFHTHARLLDGRDCYIGCSGNFTIEQIITRQCPGARIHSNDISLYTSAIGHHLIGYDLPITVTNEELLFMQTYINRGEVYPAACISLMLSMFKYEKRNNPFTERMWTTYLVNFETLLEQTAEKIRKAVQHIHIADYTMIDVHDYYPRPNGISIGFLPTYVGGYEKLFKRLDESTQWDSPHYDMLTTERREASIQKMTQGDYILYDDRDRDDLPIVARVELPGRKPVCIYSNINFRRGIFRTRVNERVKNYPLLMPDEEIHAGAEITITETDLPTINHYRSLYLSKRIQPGSGGPCYLVFAGGKLFGFLIFQFYSVKSSDPGDCYLLSDFVVPSTRHPRLAKLLLMASLCREVKQTLDGKSIKHYQAILTTAFTDKPVSMKYRGIYELVKRGKTGDGRPFLNYRGQFCDQTLKEVTATWTKKFNKPAKQPKN